jgi:CubicO group peptidase (beta-lactamase class C family)
VAFDEGAVDRIFAALDQSQAPGAAVGIAIGGKPIYRKGFGLANMELPVALSPSMRLRIGSTTKHFTCLGYMLLCEEGRAAPDDTVGKYLPELHPVTHPVEMRQLMSNTGGLRDVYDICWQFSGNAREVTGADLLALYRDIDDVNADPGTTWIYNNGGFLILGTVIERITGQPLARVFRERIFEPVGMYDTLLREFDSDFVPNSATLHMTGPGGRFNRSYLGTAQAGEGGMVSTVDDMLRWLAHMDAPVIGTAETWAALTTPQTLANGTSTGYGLGLMMGHYRGVETLSHSGGVLGGNSQMLKVPAAGLDIAVMVNRHDVYACALANEILDACLPGLDDMERAPAHAISSGVFRSPTTGRIIQLLGKHGQQLLSIDGSDWPCIRTRDGVLTHLPIWNYIQQTVQLVGDPEQPTSLHFTEFGSTDELVRVPLVESIARENIAGRYRSLTIDAQATICATNSGASLITVGRFGRSTFTLERLGEGIWRANFNGAWPQGGVLTFRSDGEGFYFCGPRNRALSFRRIG